MNKPTILLMLMLLSVSSYAKIKFPAVMGSNMVLQQKSKANLWGISKPSAAVIITTSWDNKKYTTRSQTDGKWKLFVNTPAAGGPYNISVTDGEKAILSNIMIGEVWVCSGQSNMGMKLKGGMNQPVYNIHDPLLEANNNKIRLFTVKSATAASPAMDCEGEWKVSDIQNALDFSAVAYLYGQILQKQLKVPVGLIVTAVGGTPIRSWMSENSLVEVPEVPVVLQQPLNPKDPTVLYNAMVAPLTNMTIRGFLWYQGEADRINPTIYEREMQSMVKSWRAVWNQGELPFYYVQIAPWLYPGDHPQAGALLREQQLRASRSIPGVGMAVAMDSGSDLTIHPPYKQNVAARLAYIALAKTYGFTGLPFASPVYNNLTIKDKQITLTFNNAEQGLYFKNKTSQNFEIAGDDQVFYPAKAVITSKGIVVQSEKVDKPVAVRYAFKNYADGDLYNGYGLPASSFRTDIWNIK